MDKLVNHLVELANNLDQSGNVKCANAVDALIEHKSITKVAQYVGVIGYVLKQNRAMGNCIRKKRVANSGPMQEVVLDCLKEYQDGQAYDNNEWTSKYAQVITECPEDFKSSHIEFLKVVASENDLNDHFDRIKIAHKLLQENKVEDQLISALVADINILESEGDAGHRPFKVAAPRSQRGFWNRLWSPSWTRRGKTKDVRLEMDNILDGIMNIHQGVQRFRTNSSRLRNLVNESPQNMPGLAQAVNQLSNNDWQQSASAIQNITRAVDDIATSNDPRSNAIQEISRETSDVVRDIFNEVTKIQRNMNYLRQRDAISGRGGDESLGEEYGQLDRALNQLYNNPLDQRAIYYSQKLHGALEDSIQGNWSEQDEDTSFNEWANTPVSENEEIRMGPANSPESPQGSGAGLAPPVPSISQGAGDEELANVIVEAMEQMAGGDERMLNGFLSAVEEVLMGTPGNPNSFTGLGIVHSRLQERLMGGQQPQESLTPPFSETTPTAAPEAAVAPVESEVSEKEPPWNSDIFFDDPNSTRAYKSNIFVKLADVLDKVSPELANLVDKYIEENPPEKFGLPKFPENASILKEEISLRSKITHNKEGKVAIHT